VPDDLLAGIERLLLTARSVSSLMHRERLCPGGASPAPSADTLRRSVSPARATAPGQRRETRKAQRSPFSSVSRLPSRAASGTRSVRVTETVAYRTRH
jgi:hypothetical protein